MDELRIRPFQAHDREGLVAMWIECDLTRPWNDPHRDIDRKVARGDELLLVAVGDDDPTIVGSVMAGYDGHRGWINYLAVEPSRRGEGIASRLMTEAQNQLGALGCPKVNLQIRTSNAQAVAFYETLGYVVDDVVSMGLRLVDDEGSA